MSGEGIKDKVGGSFNALEEFERRVKIENVHNNLTYMKILSQNGFDDSTIINLWPAKNDPHPGFDGR